VPPEVDAAEEGPPAEVARVVLDLFVHGPHVLVEVGLLGVDLLADVALGGRVLDHAQVGQPDVLGQVAEFPAAMRAESGLRLSGCSLAAFRLGIGGLFGLGLRPEIRDR